MREVILDTETTGLNSDNGDRIVEIGCVELVDHVATGSTYHQYVNPERPMPDEAFQIHGLSDAFLSEFPIMTDIIDEFIEFIGLAPLVIHNAEFDLRFLNAELARLDKPALKINRAIDTVRLAREKFPGVSVSLNALCKRFSIDNSSRSFHGALLDAHLLASVYLELVGGKQRGFELSPKGIANEVIATDGNRRDSRNFAVKDEELKAHARFVTKITKPIWNN
ncbi:DNA polymerase III subunit epsilon [Rhodospirillales bacterium]|nr:DNA polymerase III subunit epsilon [Rhodospirillales bacterium]